MKNKAVVLGANYYIGLSIIRCLGSQGVHVVAVDYAKNGAYGLKSKYLSEALIGPHYKKDAEGLVAFLIDYAKKQEEKPVLFPSADPYVEFVDANFDILKEYFLFSQSKKGLFTEVMDKGTLEKLAKDYTIKTPETVSPEDENFNEIVTKVIKFPCLVKPVDSPKFVAIFRKKLFKVKNMDELQKCVKKAHNANCEVIVQKMIKGFDDHMYTFDVFLNQQSKITHWTTCHKLRQYPINFGASVYTEQKYVPELFEEGKDFLEGIGWKGFAEIEFKKDQESDNYYLIEVNVRTTNLNVLLQKSGLNMPYIEYMELTGTPLKPKAITKDTGYVFWYSYEDFFAVRNYIRTKQLTIVNVIRSYFRRKAHSIWDVKDPKPYFAFIKYKVLMVIIRRLKK